MEAYIDDMVVKSKVVEYHLLDLVETFQTLRDHKLKLNASKCAFGVSSGKFLGYLVTHQRIKVNSDQIVVLQNLKPSRNPKKVQRHIEMTATLNWFISRSVDKCRPFFQFIEEVEGLSVDE